MRYLLKWVWPGLLCGLLACNRQAEPIDRSVHALPALMDAHQLLLDGDSLFIVGSAEGKGFVLGFAAGTTEPEAIVIDHPRPLYSLVRHRGNWFAGADSAHLYRGANLGNLRYLPQVPDDWTSNLVKFPVHALCADDTGLLAVVGGKLAFGAVYHSYDGGGRLNTLEYDHELRCAALADGYAWVAGNGWMMRSVWGSGNWTATRMRDHFITDMHFENSLEGWALTQDGDVLKTSNAGDDWDVARRGREVYMRALAVQGDVLIAVGEEGRFVYSLDRGASWRAETIAEVDGINDVLIHEDQVYAVADDGMMLTVPLEALK